MGGKWRQSAVCSTTYSPCRLWCLCQLLLLFRAATCCEILKFSAERAGFQPKHLCFIVYFKNVVSLVKIKLNEQGTINAQNIFITITEESDIRFANRWWNLNWNTVFNSPWACWHTRTFLALILTVANIHSMKLNSTYLQCAVITYTQAYSPCTWTSDCLSMITHAAVITIHLLNKH